jgi:hypothetical protein
VNKGGKKMNKYVEPWAKNAFNEWRIFCVFGTKKFITNFFEDEGFVKQIVDMSYFVLQVVKKDLAYIFRLGNGFFLNFLLNFIFFSRFCKKRFSV